MSDFGKKNVNNEIEGLDKDSRKELFNKFVDHGGQVVNEKKKKANKINFNRERQKELLKKQEEKKKSLQKKYGSKTGTGKSGSSKSGKTSNKENPYEGMGKVSLYFSSVFSRVRTWTGQFIHPSFAKVFRDTAQSKYLDLNLVVTTILHSKSMSDGVLKKDLILKYPLYYELLLRMDKLYEDRYFVEFGNKFGNDLSRRVKFKSIEEQIKPVLKKLYCLQPHKSNCLEAIGTALGLMQKHESISRTAINENVSNARQAINFLFSSFFDKIFLAYLNCIKSNIPVNNPIIPKLLKIKDEDMVGYIVKRIKEEIKKRQGQDQDEDDIEEEEVIEEEKDDKKDLLPDDVQNGYDLLARLPFDVNKFPKDSPPSYFEPNDKIYHVFLILEEFESQYSFVLTSNKIRYSVDYNQGGGSRLDPKKEFNEIYVKINTIHDAIREYLNILKESYEIENQHGVSMMQKHNQLHTLSIRQSKTNMNIRIKLLEIVKKLSAVISQVYDKVDRVVQNQDEKLNFDNSLEGKKRIDGKTPVEAIRFTMEVIKALEYKLDKGELSGAGMYVNK